MPVEMKGSSREVEVFVRIRPTVNFAHDHMQCLPDGQTLNIRQREDSKKSLLDCKKDQLRFWSFRLEGVLHHTSQDEVYRQVCQRVVLSALDGYNGTVMCFGQTGAGKTYTMTGSMESYKHRGILPRALQEVFHEVEKRTDHAFSVHMSYLEIYNENLVDLLSSVQPSPQPCLHSRGMVVIEEPGRGVYVKGLSIHPVHSEEEALNLMFEGEMNRIIESHALNQRSSRSHCILTVHIESHSRTLSDAKYITSKLNLVDLAGSERVGKTGTEGQLLKEAKYINKSLSFLEQAILALGDRRREYIPFRQSKLTHALKDSLGGNCNTVLVANVYGEASQIEETISTLRFATRMKCVPMSPIVNEHVDSAAEIKRLEKEVQTLKDELSIHKQIINQQSIPYTTLTEAQLAEIQSQVYRYLEGKLEEISITSLRQVQAVFEQFKLASHMQEQQFKAQLSHTSNLAVKDPSALVHDAKTVPVWESRGIAESAEHGSIHKSAHRSGHLKAKAKKAKERSDKHKKHREDTPVSKKSGENISKIKLVEEHEAEMHDTPELPVAEPEESDSPPPKAEAFEDFKAGRGKQLNIILKENKAVLLERRSLLHQLTEEVNSVKREIDRVTVRLQQHEEARRGQDVGQYWVMDRDSTTQDSKESLLVQLRELKDQYRQRHEMQCHIKGEVNYCQHLVDRCRIRLFSDFESWYQHTFVLSEDDPDTNAMKDSTMEVTSWRSEEQVQQEQLTSSSSESFHNARHRTQKRRGRQKPSVQKSKSSAPGGSRQFVVQFTQEE